MKTEKAEIWFYHCTRASPEAVLQKLLNKVLDSQKTAFVQTGVDEKNTMIEQSLWSGSMNDFIPHGLAHDEGCENFRILLGVEYDKRFQTDFLFCLHQCETVHFSSFERVIILFDDKIEDYKNWVRSAWVLLKSENYSISYWQQKENGSWEIVQSA